MNDTHPLPTKARISLDFRARSWNALETRWRGHNTVVEGYEIECPLYFGAFDCRTGEPAAAPACVQLKTCPVSVADGSVFIDMDAGS